MTRLAMLVATMALTSGCQATATGRGGGGGGAEPPPVCPAASGDGGEPIAVNRPDGPGLVGAGYVAPAGIDPDFDVLAEAQAEDALLVVVARKGCAGGAVDCVPALVRLVDGAVTDWFPLPTGHGIDRVADPFAMEWAALEDHDGDGTRELWLGYGITTTPEGGDGSWRMRIYAIFGTTPFNGRWYHVHTALPAFGTGHECHSELRALDVNCDGAPDLVVDERCQMVQCKDSDPAKPPPGCSNDAGRSQRRDIYPHQPDGSYGQRLPAPS